MLSVSTNLYIAFKKIVLVAHVNKLRNQFFLVSALFKVIYRFSTVFNERV